MRGIPTTALLLPLLLGALASSCKAEPELRPDRILKEELGLTDRDRVHRIILSGGEEQVVEPAEVRVEVGDYVAFVTADWHIHEVVFQVDSLAADARAFLRETDQVASPPLVDRDTRYVISTTAAPPGRYPFLVEGHGRPARGALVILDPARGGS